MESVNGQKSFKYSTCSSLPSYSLFLCLSPFLVSTSLSFPSWQLAMLSLRVSLYTDNSCSDLSWTALESGGSCLLYTEGCVCSTAKMKDHESLTSSLSLPSSSSSSYHLI